MSLFLLATMVIGTVGCGSTQEATVSDTVPVEEVVETPTPTPTPEPEPELTFAFMDELYPELADSIDWNCWSSDVFAYKTSDGLWGIKTIDGRTLYEPIEDLYGKAGDRGFMTFWSYDTGVIKVFDSEGYRVYEMDIPEGFKVCGYSDGYLAYWKNDDELVYDFYDINSVDSESSKYYEFTDDNIIGLSAMSLMCNGYIRVSTNRIVSIDNQDKKGISATIDKYGNVGFYWDEEDNPLLCFGAVTKDGWLAVIAYDHETHYVASSGIYNIFTGEYKKYLETDFDLKACNIDGSDFFTDGKYAECVTEKLVDDEGNETNLYQIFDFDKQDFVTDKYIYISLKDFFEHKKYALVENEEEKWGYIELATGNTTQFFDDATNFNEGYAIITENGKQYVIDEELEKKTDVIYDGDAATVSYGNSKIGKATFKLKKLDEEGNLVSSRLVIVDLNDK